jgi:hypothetical protein
LNADELARILAKAKSGSERNLWVGALLAEEAATDIVIVGGSAIEVYSSGRYVSGDIDVVGERSSIIGALERWGFRREGRLWSRSDLELWVDPVGRYYTGDVAKLRVVLTPYGLVRLASVEDLIAKRLIETKVWPRGGTELFEQAVALAAEYHDEIDWGYVTRVAEQDGAEDLVPELRRRLAPPRSTPRTPR